jgi:nucleoside-diphosphate-sugar epimerase
VKVLVTGGTGVVGNATVEALLRAGHGVRLFSRHAAEDVRGWPEGVEAWAGDVGDASSITGAADGCGAVVHIVGIVSEQPPELTFERINIGGTQQVVREATRAGVERVVFVSSLGSERGESEYQKSKLASEEIVRSFPREWVIVRLGNVYGPGDEVISALLRMVRVLPIIPVLGDGEQLFQPIWHEDAGALLAAAVDKPGIVGEVLEVAGSETTSMNDLIDRFRKITDRNTVRLPVPMIAAELSARAADAAGLDFPLKPAHVAMLKEGNTIDDPLRNALVARFGIQPKPLAEGLLELADAQPVQTPDEGWGKLKHRVVDVEIVGSRLTSDQLFQRFLSDFSEFVPIEAAAEPGTDDMIAEGRTLTLSLPLRGNIQVRVEQASAGVVTLATVEGHALAGAVRFQFADVPTGIRFTINVADRPATAVDYIGMALIGNAAQRSAWVTTAERVLEASGGTAPDGVRHSSADLDDEEAAPFEEWIEELVNRRLRREREEEASR